MHIVWTVAQFILGAFLCLSGMVSVSLLLFGITTSTDQRVWVVSLLVSLLLASWIFWWGAPSLLAVPLHGALGAGIVLSGYTLWCYVYSLAERKAEKDADTPSSEWATDDYLGSLSVTEIMTLVDELTQVPRKSSTHQIASGGESDKIRKVIEDKLKQVAHRDSKLKDEVALMQKQLEDSSVPYLATVSIRERLADQADKAEQLQKMAVKRTSLFQFGGLFVVAAGLAIIATGAVLVMTGKQDARTLGYIAPISGILFNVVGGGLIVFHRAASHMAADYYDRKQRSYDLLTALELLTNRVMDDHRGEIMPELVRSLFASPKRQSAIKGPSDGQGSLADKVIGLTD